MAKNINYVSHKKSNVKNQDGTPKLPLAADLVDGEIAVNYAEDVETLSIKNESGSVVTFSSDNYYTEKKLGSGFTGENSANTVTKVIEDNEIAVSAALNDLNERKLDASAYTPTDLTNYYTKSETSGATEIQDALDEFYDKDYIDEIELGISAALNDLETNKLDASAYTPTDLSNYYIKSQTSGATEIQNALDDKQNALSAGTNIDITDDVISVTGITIDQVLDNTTSASTNAVSTKAVYDAVTDNELVWTNAYVAMSGIVSSHTVNTDVHVTTADRNILNSLPTTLNDMASKSNDLNGLKLLKITQAEYNSLATKDPNTLYIISS